MGNLSARIKEGFSNFKDTVDTKAIEAARGMPGKIAAVGLKGGKVALDGYSMVTGNDTDVASAALSGASIHLDILRGKDIDLEREYSEAQFDAMHGGELIPSAVGLFQDVKELSEEFSHEPEYIPEQETDVTYEMPYPDEPSSGMEQWMERAEDASAAEEAYVDEGVSAMNEASDTAAQACGEYADACADSVCTYESGKSDASVSGNSANAGADASASASDCSCSV